MNIYMAIVNIFKVGCHEYILILQLEQKDDVTRNLNVQIFDLDIPNAC